MDQRSRLPVFNRGENHGGARARAEQQYRESAPGGSVTFGRSDGEEARRYPDTDRSFNEASGGGIVTQKRGKGYSLFRESTGQPVARLCPIGEGDLVEVMFWSYRGKWRQIGDFGPMVMPLEEALDFIATDPMDCFWH